MLRRSRAPWREWSRGSGRCGAGARGRTGHDRPDRRRVRGVRAPWPARRRTESRRWTLRTCRPSGSGDSRRRGRRCLLAGRTRYHAFQSGRLRSRRCWKSRPTRSATSRGPPGAGTVTRSTCRSTSKSSVSVHDGRSIPSGTCSSVQRELLHASDAPGVEIAHALEAEIGGVGSVEHHQRTNLHRERARLTGQEEGVRRCEPSHGLTRSVDAFPMGQGSDLGPRVSRAVDPLLEGPLPARRRPPTWSSDGVTSGPCREPGSGDAVWSDHHPCSLRSPVRRGWVES